MDRQFDRNPEVAAVTIPVTGSQDMAQLERS